MSQNGVLTKTSQIVALVLIAAGASLAAVSQRPQTSERHVAAAEVDFTALHRQASEALDNLRYLQERRHAPTSPAAF
jgi:hypothetical protein